MVHGKWADCVFAYLELEGSGKDMPTCNMPTWQHIKCSYLQNMKFTANISNLWAKNLLSDDYKVWDSNFKARSDWRELCTYYTCVQNYGMKANDNKKKN